MGASQSYDASGICLVHKVTLFQSWLGYTHIIHNQGTLYLSMIQGTLYLSMIIYIIYILYTRCTRKYKYISKFIMYQSLLSCSLILLFLLSFNQDLSLFNFWGCSILSVPILKLHTLEIHIWYIYLHESTIHVGKYTSPMDSHGSYRTLIWW